MSLPLRYNVIQSLGKGASGDVVLAVDHQRGNTLVAVKQLRSRLDRRTSDLIAEEFLTLSRLAHPNIARVRDFGRADDGSTFFTADYVSGGNLLEWAERHEASERWTMLIQLSGQALAALSYLTLRGVAHGDIKPANLLVEDAHGDDQVDTLRMIDFGTSRWTASKQIVEATGTPAYQPDPETLDEHGSTCSELYALGMSIYHAAAGRLPYAVGEANALESWRCARQPALLRVHAPEAPSVLNDLVERLTSFDQSQRFSSAADALAFLRDRVGLVPNRPRDFSRHVLTVRRREVMEQITRQSVEQHAAFGCARVLLGPEGSGKKALLDTFAARLQVEGFQVVSFRGWDDVRALEETRELATELSGRPLNHDFLDEEDVADLIYRLRSDRVALLVAADEHSREPSGTEDDSLQRRQKSLTTFLRALTSNLLDARRERSSRNLPILCIALRDSSAIEETLGQSVERFEVDNVDALSEDEVDELCSEFFLVDSVPSSLRRRVLDETDGLAVPVWNALERLACVGVHADFMGHLKIPTTLPEKLVDDHRADLIEHLNTKLRRALGLLIITGEPLSARELAERFPEKSAQQWDNALTQLRSRGLSNAIESGTQIRYKTSLSIEREEIGKFLTREEELDARHSLAHYFSAHTFSELPLESQLAAVRNDSACGEITRALRLAFRVAPRLFRRQRDRDLLLLAEELSLHGQPLTGATSNEELCLRLRVAYAEVRLGRYEQAATLVDSNLEGLPPWYRFLSSKLKARAYESAGDLNTALTHLDINLGDGQAKAFDENASAAAIVRRHELLALTAPLCASVGRPEQGKKSLSQVNEFVERFHHLPESVKDLAGVRVLSHYASGLAVYDDRDRALELLQETLRIARQRGVASHIRSTLNELGILHVRSRRSSEAINVFLEIEEIARQEGDRLSALRATYNRAVTHYQLRDFDAAEAVFAEARRISEDLGVHAFSATIWLGLAGVLREKGRQLEAIRFYRRVLRPHATTRPNDIALAHNNLGEIYLYLGRFEKALSHSEQALAQANEINNRFLITTSTCLYGIVHWALGSVETAKQHFNSALQLASDAGELRMVGYCRWYLGRVAASEGELSNAVRTLRQGVIASREAKDSIHVRLGTLSLLEILLRQGKRKGARRWVERARRNRGQAAARGAVVESAVATRASVRWPETGNKLPETVDKAIARGDLWESFLVAREILLTPDLPTEIETRLRLQQDVLATELLRRMPPTFRDGFERFWLPDSSTFPSIEVEQAFSTEASGECASKPAVELSTRTVDGLLTEFLAEPFESGLSDSFLARVSSLAGAKSLLVLEMIDGAMRPRPDTLRQSGDWRKCLERFHAASLTGKRQPHRDYPFVFERLSPPPSRVVCFEYRLNDEDYVKCVEHGRVHLAALLVGCALRMIDVRTDAAENETVLAEAKEEVRRLNTLMIKNVSDLETEFMTRHFSLREAQRQLDTTALREAGPRRRLIGSSSSMAPILDRLQRIAVEGIPVLLVGESGVGKDLIARWIHHLSQRRDRPFLSEVCNLTPSLVEAELFGFVRGAFTDAIDDRQGVLQRVAGGTIYLDEVTDLSNAIQAKMLRVLEESKVRPVGGDKSVAVDFRLIASSRQPVSVLREGGLLRRDLFYRLSGEIIEVPPLRERLSDLPDLAREILEDLAREADRPPPYVQGEALELWESYDWPGNIRELENELQRLLLDQPVEITADAVRRIAPPRITTPTRTTEPIIDDEPMTLKEARSRTERQLIRAALKRHDGKVTSAAKELEVTRRYLTTLIDKHGLRDATGRGGSSPGTTPQKEEGSPE